MTAAILSIPGAISAEHAEFLRREVVCAARDILRSPASHSDETLTWACIEIKHNANPYDPDELCAVLESDAMLHSINCRNRKSAPPVPENPRAGSIRLALIDFAAFVVAMGAVGAVFLGGPV